MYISINITLITLLYGGGSTQDCLHIPVDLRPPQPTFMRANSLHFPYTPKDKRNGTPQNDPHCYIGETRGLFGGSIFRSFRGSALRQENFNFGSLEVEGFGLCTRGKCLAWQPKFGRPPSSENMLPTSCSIYAQINLNPKP